MAKDNSKTKFSQTFFRGDQSVNITFKLHGKEHFTLRSLSLKKVGK